ncbi:unnamed protein product, partial [Notodromas monacha]
IFAQRDPPSDRSGNNPLTNQQRIDDARQRRIDQRLNQDQQRSSPDLIPKKSDASAAAGNPQDSYSLTGQRGGWGNRYDDTQRNRFPGGNAYGNRDFQQDYLGPDGAPIGDFAHDYTHLDRDPAPEPFNEDNELWEPSSIRESDGEERSEVISHGWSHLPYVPDSASVNKGMSLAIFMTGIFACHFFFI